MGEESASDSANAALAASLIGASTSALAGFAAAELLEGGSRRSAPANGSFDLWKAHMAQRLQELRSALLLEEPELFAAQVRWLRTAFESRKLTVDDLESSLAALGVVLEQELSGAVAGVPGGYLERARQLLHEPAESAEELSAEGDEGRLAFAYLEVVLAGDRRRGIDLLSKAAGDGLELLTLYERVLMPVQVEVGRLWHLGKIGVAEEHFATATAQRAMAVLAQNASRAAKAGKTVVATSVAGNAHALALNAVADLLELEGWRAIVLGADTPTSALREGLVTFEADVLAISATLVEHIPSVKGVIDAVRAAEETSGVKVLVGGRAFDEVPEVWRKIGADAYAATLSGAVVEAARLVAG